MEDRDKDIIKQNPEEDEIDLMEIVRKLWIGRKLIIRVTLAYALLGLVIAILTPNYYTASCTMVPQTGAKSATGNLSGLAAIAGINLGSMSSGEVLSPTVYPKILKNVNFQKELLYSEYSFAKAEKPVSYYEYATNKQYRTFSLLGTFKRYTIGLPSVIIGAFRNNNVDQTILDSTNVNGHIYSLTSKENKVINGINSNLSLNLNSKDGYITISYTSAEPKVAAEVVLKAQQLLQKYITEFKLEKVRSNLEFVERSYDEAKQNFEVKQAELARFRDANKSLTSAMARTQEEKLISEYNLLLSVYTELAKQKEQAKIAVTETTPILTVIQPVIVPTDKAGPKRSTLIIGFVFFGILMSSMWIIISPSLKKYTNR
ncbi:MAG: Wzz/FepE/Etk N-terminal domain-containing protein [Bacteroidales bacterium]|nr:Wzz/FepE/Etk N-terminal domain-containing protein [Bacteroidales bacterium]